MSGDPQPRERRPGVFEILAVDAASQARRGRLHTAHGAIETPAFMPVGTRGTVKTMTPDDLATLGFDVVLANAYHLHVRPGEATVEALGGLHRFMGWPRAILTDSGGYQVFSLSRLRRITDDGVEFRSPYDGALVRLTPETAMEIQRRLGADIAMALDECPPGDCGREAACQAVDRTLQWAVRCARQPRAEGGMVFGIVQGGGFPDLRARCAAALLDLGFDGMAIGGVSVGEPNDRIRKAVDDTVPHLPAGRPRYVMGVGGVGQMLDMVASGIDLFDCVMPTRLARHGTALTRAGRYPLKSAAYARDPRPIEEGCPCPACRGFSRGYLRHLLRIGEILGVRLLSLHNLHVYADFMRRIREAIENGRLTALRDEIGAAWRDPMPAADPSDSTKGTNR